MKLNGAALAAIVSLTILESLALYLGVDGVIFSAVVAVVAGLGGYKLKEVSE